MIKQNKRVAIMNVCVVYIFVSYLKVNSRALSLLHEMMIFDEESPDQNLENIKLIGIINIFLKIRTGSSI